MGTGFSKKKKQAKLLQSQFTQMQKQLEETEFAGVAANGLVEITLSGSHEMKKIKINPDCVDKEDIEGLQDLIKVAYQDALKKINSQASGMGDLSSLSSMLPGLG